MKDSLSWYFIGLLLCGVMGATVVGALAALTRRWGQRGERASPNFLVCAILVLGLHWYAAYVLFLVSWGVLFPLSGWLVLIGPLVSFGLLRFQQWARRFALMNVGALIAGFSLRAAYDIADADDLLARSWPIIFGGSLLLWYFLRPSVKAQFQRPSA